jgi:hypothetical protein
MLRLPHARRGSYGTYNICNVCFWEDDGVQFHDIDYEGGANKVSLNQARQNFRELWRQRIPLQSLRPAAFVRRAALTGRF